VRKKRKRKHTNEGEKDMRLYDINIHSTRRFAIAIIIFVFNKSTVLRRVYSTTHISSLHIKKKKIIKKGGTNRPTRKGGIVVILRNNVIRR